jgi:hypothetical protein
MIGRPTKYRPEMCQQVVELMRDGASLVEVAASIGITKDTLHRWKKTNDEFSDSIKIGTQLSEAWWMREGREALRDKDFNSTLWYMNMKNRHGWADKVEKQEQHNIRIEWAGAAPEQIADAEVITPKLGEPQPIDNTPDTG